MVLNARKVINAHGEFVIGLKRTSEPKRKHFSLKLSTTYTLFARKSRDIVRRLHCDFCNFELPSGIFGFPRRESQDRFLRLLCTFNFNLQTPCCAVV
jgi:hypothetical protein